MLTCFYYIITTVGIILFEKVFKQSTIIIKVSITETGKCFVAPASLTMPLTKTLLTQANTDMDHAK